MINRRSIVLSVATVTCVSVAFLAACVGDSDVSSGGVGDSDAGAASDGATQNGGDSGSPPGSDGGAPDGGEVLDASPTGAYVLDVLGPDGINGQATAFDASGNIIVALTSLGTVTIAGQTFALDGGGGSQLVIVKLDPTGKTLLWARQFHSTASYDGILGVTVDATGDVYVAGQFGGPSMAIGAYVVPNVAGNQNSSLVFKLSGVDGAARWATTFDTASTTQIILSTIDARSKGGGEVIVTGTFQGALRAQMSSGSYNATAGAGQNNGFVLDLDTGTGNAFWGRTYSSTTTAGSVAAISAVRDANDAVVISGAYLAPGLKDDAPAGAQMIPMAISAAGNADAFVVRVNSANPHVVSWQKSYGFHSAVPTVLSNGNVVFCGSFNGKANPGKGELTSMDQTASTYDAVLWAVDPTTGATTWQDTWGGAFDDRCVAAVSDGTGDVIVIGQHSAGGLTLGGLALGAPPPVYLSSHPNAVDVVKVNGATGVGRWAYTATSTTPSSQFTAASVDVLKSSQAILYSGAFTGDADFGGGSRTSGQPQGNTHSTFVVKRAR